MLVATEDDFALTELGDEPPALGAGPLPGSVPGVAALGGFLVDCHRPAGPRGAVLSGLAAEMGFESPATSTRRIERAYAARDVGRLLDLVHAFALSADGQRSSAALARAAALAPEHPEVRLVEAQPHAESARWKELRRRTDRIDPRVVGESMARHACHVRALALLHTGAVEEALRVVELGLSFSDGLCDLGMMRALATPLAADEGQAWSSDQARVRAVLRAVETADICLSRGELREARAALGSMAMAGVREVQSLARRASAWLRGAEVDEAQRFDKAHALSTFCAAHADRSLFSRCELPIPWGSWDQVKLDHVAARATAWLDANLGAPSPPAAKS
jgi:hypothetical protein